MLHVSETMIAMQLSGQIWLIIAQNSALGVFHINKERYAVAYHLCENRDGYLAVSTVLEEIRKLFDA